MINRKCVQRKFNISWLVLVNIISCTQLPFIYYIFLGEGGGGKFWKEKDWIIKSFSNVTVTIYEFLCSSLNIIINVFNTVSGKIIKQAVVSTVMLSEN